MIAPSGFRDYDARWRYPQEISLEGFARVGRAIGTQMHRRGLAPEIVVGRDFRSYSEAVKTALAQGLAEAGIAVSDIGLSLTPMAYFARAHLGIGAVAMVTASHNPNGWTGVKLGFVPPFTHGPDEMAELARIALAEGGEARPGGRIAEVLGVAEAYLDDLAKGVRLSYPLRVVCATGNGTAGAFVPKLLDRIGAEVIHRHTALDAGFPHYNPNPEAMEMLADMSAALRESGADLALGFDGDGDRVGVVDNEGHELFADKLGLLLARDFAGRFPGARFIADVKSTGLFAADPVLATRGARAEYWKTGHSHMKARLAETGALAAFEKSGHIFLAPPLGRGYDCAPRAAVALLDLLARSGQSLAALARSLPRSFLTPTLSPACPDPAKYAVLERIAARLFALRAAGGTLGGHGMTDILAIDGARVALAHGGFALVRASSNTPNLVIVCESPDGEADLRAIFADLDRIVRAEPEVGAYDQMF
jgi:phosphomannomutase/phosphoglucomutase